MKKVLIILVVFFSLSACEMGINPKNYPFYCEIDGKKFVPERDTRPIGGIGSDPYSYEFSHEDKSFFIRVRNSPKVVILLVRFPDGVFEAGEYSLSDNISSSSYAYLNANNNKRDSHSYSQSGWVKITEVDGNKFNGEFEFTTYNEYLGRTVKVTNGKFRNK